jgi:hypothetical protein
MLSLIFAVAKYFAFIDLSWWWIIPLIAFDVFDEMSDDE